MTRPAPIIYVSRQNLFLALHALLEMAKKKKEINPCRGLAWNTNKYKRPGMQKRSPGYQNSNF